MRHSSISRILVSIAFGLVAFSGALGARAQTADHALQIHGFGDWVYGRTDGNLFLSGDNDGNYGDASFGLNVRYDVSDRIVVVGQVAFEHANGATGEAGGGAGRTTLDYAFGQYTANDKLHFRFGRTYHPFGLYGEIRDIGTARPFIERPPEIYGDLEIISGSLEGLDVYGDVLQSWPWRLHYDVYAGATELPVAEAGEAETHIDTMKSVIGGRLAFETPVDGLRFAVSAFQGTREDSDERHRSEALSIEYGNDKWLVRGEVAQHTESPEGERVRSAYVEGAFRVAGPWQITARWGGVRQHGGAPVDPTFLSHRATGVGVNYWLDPRVVLKAEYHMVRGNRLALPDSDNGGQIRHKTRAFQAGVQFSF
jgi:hypothetical protein